MKQIIKLLMVMLMLGGVACTTNDLDGGNPDNNEHNQIWYTATEKVIPYATIVFGANIVSNVWNETTGEGVITCDGEITRIGHSAFSDCRSLVSITIPESVTRIGDWAFYGCRSLASITIPESVTGIGSEAFYGCSSLESITFPEGVSSIESGVFYQCARLHDFTIPESVTRIGDVAFYGCRSLASITIPEGVTSIGDNAFYGCSSLAEFNGKFASEDGRCLVKDGELISFAPYGLTEYTIPDGVTSIGDEAFYYCRSLESVTIPEGVTSIGAKAFYYCQNLAEVYCKPTTPPSGEKSDMFNYNAPRRKIYVPSESVEAYKTAEKWSDYAGAIEGYDFE